MKSFLSSIACVSISLALVACGSDSATPTAAATTPVVWTNTTVQKLVAAKCATSGCHATGGTSPILTNVAEATFKANTSAKNDVTVSKVMPKGSTLSAADLKSFTDFFK